MLLLSPKFNLVRFFNADHYPEKIFKLLWGVAVLTFSGKL